MPTSTESRLSVKLPGGAIVHLKGGSSKNLQYGETVPSDVAEYVDLDRIADEAPRANPLAAELEAHRRAALSENGQLNSSSSVVPGNYSDLDEDAASRLVSNLAIRPLAQASLVKYEILFGGNRQKVLDAASDAALVRANLEIDALDTALVTKGVGDVVREPVVGSLGDPDLQSPEQAARLSREALRTPAPAEAPDGDSSKQQRTAPDGNNLTVPPADEIPEGVKQGRETDNPEAEGRNTPETVDGGEVPAWDAKDPENPSQNVWTKGKLVKYAEQHNIEVASSDNRDKLIEKVSAQHPQPETPPAE